MKDFSNIDPTISRQTDGGGGGITGEDYVLRTYYEVVPRTSSGNQVTTPTGAEIVLNKFASSGNAILSTVDGNNRPEWKSPKDSVGSVVTTDIAVNGTYTFSGTPEVTYANVAVIYVFKIKIKDLGNVNLDFVIAENEIEEENSLSVDLDSSISNVTRTVAGGRTFFQVTHNFNTKNISVEIWRKSDGRTLNWRVERTGVDTVEASRAGTVADGLHTVKITK